MRVEEEMDSLFKGLLESIGDITFICEVWWQNKDRNRKHRIFYATSDRVFDQWADADR